LIAVHACGLGSIQRIKIAKYAIKLDLLAFAAMAISSHILAMLQCSTLLPPRYFPMFSLMSLYFAYRRDVVVAERYMPALSQGQEAQEPAVSVEATVEAPAASELPLAA